MYLAAMLEPPGATDETRFADAIVDGCDGDKGKQCIWCSKLTGSDNDKALCPDCATHHNRGFDPSGEGRYYSHVASVATPRGLQGRYIVDGTESSDFSDVGKERDEKTRGKAFVIYGLIALLCIIVVGGLVGMTVGILLTSDDVTVDTGTAGPSETGPSTTITTQSTTDMQQNTTMATVNLNAIIDDRQFTEELRDNKSMAYMEAVVEITSAVKPEQLLDIFDDVLNSVLEALSTISNDVGPVTMTSG
eukprot:XP_011665526.1 PREDICTED: uncharacterized protein LOC105438875 [Strongylocentrotus purpuratus]